MHSRRSVDRISVDLGGRRECARVQVAELPPDVHTFGCGMRSAQTNAALTQAGFDLAGL
jgi:hypothetical protein